MTGDRGQRTETGAKDEVLSVLKLRCNTNNRMIEMSSNGYRSGRLFVA